MEAVSQTPLRPEDQHLRILALRHLDCATGLRPLAVRKDGGMRSKRVILHRATYALLALVAVAAFSGCSSVEPEDAWADETGRVSGTVRSDSGNLLPEIEVWLWVELEGDAGELRYQTQTDEYGAFEFEGVEMATQHAYETTYWIGANRTPYRSTSINTDYTSIRSTVTVPKGGTCEWNAVIDSIGDPDDPETYLDN